MRLRHRCRLDPLETRAMLAIEAALSPVAVTASPDLLVQSASSASMGSDGRSLAVWSDRDSVTGKGKDVFLRRFAITGQPIDGVTSVNATTAGAQMNPGVAATVGGKAYVVWQSQGQDGAGWGAYLRAYNADGTPLTGEVQVSNVTTGDQVMPRVAVDGSGTVAVCWTIVNGDGSTDVYARRFDANGSPLGNEFRVNPTAAGRNETPEIAAADGGGFAVAWTKVNVATDGNADVQAQFYDANGAAVGSTITVNATLAGGQASPTIAWAGPNAAGESRYAIAWTDAQAGDPEASVYVRLYSAGGVARSTPTQANQDSDGDRTSPRLAGGGSGNFIVGWTQQQSGVAYGYSVTRSFDATLAPASNESPTGDGSSARTLFGLVNTGNGTFVDLAATGESIGAGALTTTAYRNVIAFADAGGQADTIVVDEPDAQTVRTVVNGVTQNFPRYAYAGLHFDLGAGNDLVTAGGTTLSATVAGGGGDDSITTGGATDSLAGGSGDSVSGSDGNDVISLGAGNDYAIGDAGNDRIYGGSGKDTLTGGAGKDSLYGGDDDDRLAGSGSPDSLNGEGGDDRLYGDDGDDRLDGGGNVDRLWGGAGNDYLDGGSSNDRVYGEAGNDTLAGGSSGADYLDGGDGLDRAIGNLAGDTLISIEG